MTEKVTGWDTIGSTGVGIMDANRLRLEFTGKDGRKQNIFVPVTSIGPCIASVTALLSEAYRKGHISNDVGQELASQFLLGISQTQIASDKAGSEYVVTFVTRDGLSLQFHLDPNTTQALAEGLVSVLLKHGRTLDLQPSAGSRH
ncbi:MAG: hypothetical protein IIA72_18935 [Proteobacteria bacterium]|nr:hypothetical protein [Pseudomonadota bacterium]